MHNELNKDPIFLDRKDVAKLVNLSPTSLWRMYNRGEFPRPRRLGTGRVGWLLTEVTAWVNSRPTA